MHDTGSAHDELAGSVVLITDCDVPSAEPSAVAAVPAVFVSHNPSQLADVVIPESELAALVEAVRRAPLASFALAMLLRFAEERSLEQGLLAESTTYSMLQGGPEFLEWRRNYHSTPRVPEIGPVVRVEPTEPGLDITLTRPHVHNAFSRRMRDELCEALTLAVASGPECHVSIRGSGRSFCSGGDLSEFGSFPSIAESHITRLQRSPARLLARLSDRTTVYLHGACMGAGIELPAYARRVLATPDTTISLPEIGLGLIPGAGGTWSIPRRIGRQRTAWLGLTGQRIDAVTAQAWGLVDEIVEPTA